MRQFIQSEEFFNLSALLSYQLSATPIDWPAVLKRMLGRPSSGTEREIILEIMRWLGDAYGQRRRKLGSLAVLHPIRCAALLAMALKVPPMLDALAALLHDKEEDLKESEFLPAQAYALRKRYDGILDRLSADERWYLEERIGYLTRKENERYYRYLGSLLGKAKTTGELVRIKLADRLDNTLDMRISSDMGPDQEDPYRSIFASMFGRPPRKAPEPQQHPGTTRLSGATRLYQLFKNAVLLSLVRKSGLDRIDKPTCILFDTLASSSANEAVEVVSHVFTYHLPDAHHQRNILMDVQAYCQSGGIECITRAASGCRLDGLFLSTFDPPERPMLDQILDGLYADKARMAEAAAVFAAIFETFRRDPEYRIKGIDFDGIRPDAPGVE